jgi:hypothetical protein
VIMLVGCIVAFFFFFKFLNISRRPKPPINCVIGRH